MKTKSLSPEDVSLLALIAENPRVSGGEFVVLLNRLSPEAQKIAHVIVKLGSDRPGRISSRPRAIQKAAHAIYEWAMTNRKNSQKAVPARSAL